MIPSSSCWNKNRDTKINIYYQQFNCIIKFHVKILCKLSLKPQSTSCLHFPSMHSIHALLHVLFFFCTRCTCFSVSFHTGRERGTITYNDSLKYFKTAKHVSIFGMELMLPTEENADGLLHKFTKKRHIEVSRCKWLRYGLLYGILYQS